LAAPHHPRGRFQAAGSSVATPIAGFLSAKTRANEWERDRLASKIVEPVQAGEIDPQRLGRAVIIECNTRLPLPPASLDPLQFPGALPVPVATQGPWKATDLKRPDLQPIVSEDIGGRHKGPRARDTDCEKLGENLPDDIHALYSTQTTQSLQNWRSNESTLGVFSDDGMTLIQCCKEVTKPSRYW
jgi:hypothetical protein